MRRIAPMAFVLAMVAATAMPASAATGDGCDCGLDAAAGFEEADAVFIGQVERLQDARDGGSGYAVAIFEVSDVFKGAVDREQGIATYVDDDCTSPFESGEVYLVYATSDVDPWPALEDGFLAADSCSSAVPASQVGEIDLPQASAPADAGPPTAVAIQAQVGNPRSSLFPEALIFVGALAFILGLAAWFSRKGRPAV